MRSLACLCLCYIAAANADIGGVENKAGKFLASVSRHAMASGLGGAEGAEYARETQAPMVWLNLHKSHLNTAFSSPSVAYEDYASKRIVE